MDNLERICQGLGRRDAALRDGLRAVIVALRDHRSYCDSLYDQVYDLQQSVEELQRHCGFPEQSDAPATPPMEVEPGPAPVAVEEPAPPAPQPGGGGPGAQLAPVAAKPAGDAEGVPIGRPNNVGIEPDPLEAILASIEERESHAAARFESIQRKDQETRDRLKKILAAGRPANKPTA